MIPRSLFGRLVLVLLLGLVLAQILSAWILLRDRGEVAREVLRAGIAQRTADLVQLLDNMPNAQRERAVTALSIPPLHISLASAPITTGNDPDANSALATLLESRLRQLLPSGFRLMVTWQSVNSGSRPRRAPRTPIRAVEDPELPPWPPDRRRPFSRHQRHTSPAGFLVQVRLTDGTWLLIDRRVPERLLALPFRLIATLVILLMGVVLVSLVAVRWLTRPLRTLAQAADQLGRDIDRPPLPERGSTEVKRAAQAFNTMQRRLKRYLNDRARVLAAISHDLKTPITRLRLRAELTEDPRLKEKINADLDDMEAMVSATLDFVRSDGEGEQSQLLDLEALLESLVENALDSDWNVRLVGHVRTTIMGKPHALKRCLNNLVENAVRYGKSADIEIEDNASELRIRVRDQGQGIPESELERIFDPFYRLEVSRSRHTGGTGLGLGIARNIARAHGGDLTLANHPTGGLVATVILPRASG